MATFNGVDQYIDLSNLDTSNGRLFFELTLSADMTVAAYSSCIYAAGSDAHQFLINSSGNEYRNGNMDHIRIDDVPESVIVSNALNGTVLGWRHYSAVSSTARLFMSNAGTLPCPISASQLVIKSDINPSTTLHTFDLSNPTSETITDSVGSATLTLVGFTFEPSTTTINVDIPEDIDLLWDQTYQLAVTHDGGTTTLDGVMLSKPAGWNTMVLASLHDLGAGLPENERIKSLWSEAQSDVTVGNYTGIVGDTYAWTVTSQTVPGSTLSFDNETVPTVTPPDPEAAPGNISGQYKIWDSTLETWSPVSTFTITDAGVFVEADTEAPVITLTGSSSINITEGDAYVEQGATWTDNVDGSGAATVGGDTVDVNTVGTYTVTYNYTDAAGNAATQVTRTVNVVAAGADTEAPVITLTGPSTVYVIEGGSYSELGATWADNVDGSGAATVGGDTVDPNTVGTYIVTYSHTDVAGNAASQVSRTVQVISASGSSSASDRLAVKKVAKGRVKRSIKKSIITTIH